MSNDLLRELAKDLPFERPTAARRDALRSSLLVEAAETTRPVATARRWPIVAGFVAGALAAAAIAMLVIRKPAPVIERANLAQVTASSSDVRIDHQIAATEQGSDEIVRLRDGTISLAIPAQRRGDRMIVKTTTADVEADAGELEVTVANEQLQSVRVKAGTARVVVIGQTPVVLSAGQVWHASVITADLSPPQTSSLPPTTTIAATSATTTPITMPTQNTATTKPPAATTAATMKPLATISPRTPSPTPTEASSASTKVAAPIATPSAPTVADATPVDEVASIEQRFQRGWALLKAGRAQQAAAELGAAADASPASPLAADARYFQAVALVRANDPRAAERVLVQFLDAAPTSLRRGRAAVLLGRLLAERGDPKSARAWLETAASDPDPAIAAAAKAGLQTLKPRD